MKELTVAATTQNIETVTNFINGELEEHNCSMKVLMQIDIAVDEIFGNIAHYAYAPQTGDATVRVEICENPSVAVITFVDKGIPYNPLEKEDPNVNLSIEEREIGGLGIFMVKKSMDELSYEYKDGQNILTVKKAI